MTQIATSPPPASWERIALHNRRIAPKLRRQAKRLEELALGASDRVERELRAAARKSMALIRDAINNGVTADQLLAATDTLQQIEASINGAMAGVGKNVRQHIELAVLAGGGMVEEIVRSEMPSLRMSFGAVPERMVQELEERSLSFVTDLSDDTMRNVRHYLAEGVAQGKPLSEIAKSLAEETDLGKGAFASPIARARTLARTEMKLAADRGSAAFAEDLAQQIPDIQEKFFYYHTGVCDGSCAGAATGGANGDGVYPRGVGPRPVLSTHPNCNCARIPWSAAWGL